MYRDRHLQCRNVRICTYMTDVCDHGAGLSGGLGKLQKSLDDCSCHHFRDNILSLLRAASFVPSSAPAPYVGCSWQKARRSRGKSHGKARGGRFRGNSHSASQRRGQKIEQNNQAEMTFERA